VIGDGPIVTCPGASFARKERSGESRNSTNRRRRDGSISIYLGKWKMENGDKVHGTKSRTRSRCFSLTRTVKIRLRYS